VGIKINFVDNIGNPHFDDEFIKAELGKQSLSDQFIINPIKEAEQKYRTQEHDELVVLALNAKALNGLNKVNFQRN
jgi:hypothetical protein